MIIIIIIIMLFFSRRPETSFFWLTSPLKTFKHIVWKYYKWHIIFGIILVLTVIMLVIFIYTAPVSYNSLNNSLLTIRNSQLILIIVN